MYKVKNANTEVEKNYSKKKFILKLHQLIKNLESRRDYVVQIRNNRVRIPQRVKFYIEHERENDSEEVEFSIRWKKQRK